MGNRWMVWMVLLLPALAFAQIPAAKAPKKITPPRFLKASDKVPGAELESPGDSVQGVDGGSLDVEESVQAPEAAQMAPFADPILFERIKKSKVQENTPEKFYWHSEKDLDYCHYRDIEGNHWYGWADGREMHWVLWRGNRYWWKDGFAGLWLYFDRGYWWRADGQKNGQTQVYLDGEYYLCGKNGTILADEGQDGKGAIISGPGPFRGDFHGGHGGHGGSGHSGGQGSGGANPGAGNGS